jgi:hypothetical protein
LASYAGFDCGLDLCGGKLHRIGRIRADRDQGIQTDHRPGRQGRHLGADAAGIGRAHAGNGENDAEGLFKKYGVRALGIEYNADMVELSKRNAEKEGVADRAQFVNGDIFQTDFSKATVLTLYLLPNLNLKLRPTILAMKPGTRVVSHAFSMGEWQPDDIQKVEGRTAYLWIVPAQLEGVWRVGSHNYELLLQQHFQEVEGLARANNRMAQFRNARLQGDHISFSVIEFSGMGNVQRDFTGQVHGEVMEGVVKRSDAAGEEKWMAKRVATGDPMRH